MKLILKFFIRNEYVIVKFRGGTNSSMFANCLVFGDVREVRSSVFGQNHMFGHVRSSVLMILKNIGPIFY